MSKLTDWLEACGMKNIVSVSVTFQSDKTRFETIGAAYASNGEARLFVLGNRAELPYTLRNADGFCDTGDRENGRDFWYLASYTPADYDFNSPTGQRFAPFGHNMIFCLTDKSTFLAITADRRRDLRIYDLIIK